jgi:hypothetical protein
METRYLRHLTVYGAAPELNASGHICVISTHVNKE